MAAYSNSLLQKLTEHYSNILSFETESKKRELSLIDEKIYSTKLQLSRLRLLLLTELERNEFANDSYSSRPVNSPVCSSKTGTKSIDTPSFPAIDCDPPTSGCDLFSTASLNCDSSSTLLPFPFPLALFNHDPPTPHAPMDCDSSTTLVGCDPLSTASTGCDPTPPPAESMGCDPVPPPAESMGCDPVPPICTSWIEFEKQFLIIAKAPLPQESDHDNLASAHSPCTYDWCIQEASEMLSTDTKPPCDVDSTEPMDDSRFYIKRHVIVGNTSQYLKKGVRVAGDPSTHKWMVYVRSGPSEPPLHTFIKSVSFFLHPTYAPNDIIVLGKPPFQLTRLGWGEFPVRVQLHFKDSAHKPTDILHHLKLDHTHTGQQMLGNETSVSIELVKLDDGVHHHSRNHDDDESANKNEGTINQDQNSTINSLNTLNNMDSHSIAIWQILQGIAKKMPLYGSDKTLVCYGANSLKEFSSWNIVKQRAIEWMRAVDIKRLVRNTKAPGADHLTTREIVMWCRINGHTPHPVSLSKVASGIGIYCKQCGKQLDSGNNCPCKSIGVTQTPFSTSVLDVLSTSSNYNKIRLLQECSTQSDNVDDPTQYRVPKSPELKWVHKTCLEIGTRLFPQFHDGMLLHVTDHMIFSAASQFVYQLLKSAVTMETDSFDWSKERVIVPNLICSAIVKNSEFDFLTDNGLTMF